jgi:predicted nucleic acid-binding protein
MISADTNIFVYLWDEGDTVKREVAKKVYEVLSAQDKTLIGLQVIGELQNVLLRKLKQPVFEAAQNARNLLMRFDTFRASEQNALESLAMMAAGRMSYWDALLLTAARDQGCLYFITEDLSHGFKLGPLTVVNPFAAEGPSLAFIDLVMRIDT